jgi:hypothetical protein
MMETKALTRDSHVTLLIVTHYKTTHFLFHIFTFFVTQTGELLQRGTNRVVRTEFTLTKRDQALNQNAPVISYTVDEGYDVRVTFSTNNDENIAQVGFHRVLYCRV